MHLVEAENAGKPGVMGEVGVGVGVVALGGFQEAQRSVQHVQRHQHGNLQSTSLAQLLVVRCSCRYLISIEL